MYTIVTRPVTTNYGNYDRNISVLRGTGALKPGQVIDAFTLTNSSQGQISIRIGETVINASTSLSLPQNAHLSLEVVQVSPHLLLRLIPSSAGAAATRPLQDAMIKLLPQQSAIAPVLAELIHKSMVDKNHLEHQLTRSLVNSLISNLATRNSLVHAESVRQSILLSGLFLESILSKMLGRHRRLIARDTKAALSGIQQSIGQDIVNITHDSRILNNQVSSLAYTVPPPRRKHIPTAQARIPFSLFPDTVGLFDDHLDLYGKIQGAIARLGLLQVCTAENFLNGDELWQLEIPVKHTDAVETVSISIEYDRKDPQCEERNAWIVNLALDLPQLGPVQIRISLYKHGVSSCFRSESSKTLSLIESHFGQLKNRLNQQGMETLALCCQTGQAETEYSVHTDHSIIDVQA